MGGHEKQFFILHVGSFLYMLMKWVLSLLLKVFNVMVPMFSLIASGMSFQILGKVAIGSSISFLLSPLWGMKMFLLRFRSRAKVLAYEDQCHFCSCIGL